jgi:transposase-like protein
MDPSHVFCPNLDCPARGRVGQGNIGVHSQKESRFSCSVCGQTFSARRGTVFFRCRVAPAVILQVLTLIAYGCPIPAIVAAFGFQARTVRQWVRAAGAHCERLHEQQVEQPRALGQVQADELRVKTQRGVFWLAMAIAVPTRLWLGGVVSAHRDQKLIAALAVRVRACAVAGALLLAVDGLAAYVKAFRRALRSPEPTGQVGRPRLLSWKGVVIGQVIKQRERRRVVAVVRRRVQGSAAALRRLLLRTQGGGVLNTAYIERLNATFRARLALLGRRTRVLARGQEVLRAGMYLIGTVYNFCTDHDSLALREGARRTPAMAAGITDHVWSVAEVLWHRIAPAPWQPPKRRGRRSKAMQHLVQRWAS